MSPGPGVLRQQDPQKAGPTIRPPPLVLLTPDPQDTQAQTDGNPATHRSLAGPADFKAMQAFLPDMEMGRRDTRDSL
jgi:hypothetical protein